MEGSVALLIGRRRPASRGLRPALDGRLLRVGSPLRLQPNGPCVLLPGCWFWGALCTRCCRDVCQLLLLSLLLRCEPGWGSWLRLRCLLLPHGRDCRRHRCVRLCSCCRRHACRWSSVPAAPLGSSLLLLCAAVAGVSCHGCCRLTQVPRLRCHRRCRRPCCRLRSCSWELVLLLLLTLVLLLGLHSMQWRCWPSSWGRPQGPGPLPSGRRRRHFLWPL